MKLMIILGLMLTTLSAQAKIITKEAVARNFLKGLENCNCILEDFEVDPATVKVELSDNPKAYVYELAQSIKNIDNDFYDISADFWKDGKRYRLDYVVYVEYQNYYGGLHHYELRTWDEDKAESFKRVKTNQIIPGKTTFTYSWGTSKKYWP